MSKSIKQEFIDSINDCELIYDPYKHIICDKIFCEKSYKSLLSEFPNNQSFGTDINKNNFMICLGPKELGDNQQSYMELMNYICSKDFFLSMINKLNLEETISNKLKLDISNITIGVEGQKYEQQSDFILDCRLGINTPNNRLSSVRDAHIDATKVL